MNKPNLEYLMAREQLIEEIEQIVEDFEWKLGHDELTLRLSNAVCKHFPTTVKVLRSFGD